MMIRLCIAYLSLLWLLAFTTISSAEDITSKSHGDGEGGDHWRKIIPGPDSDEYDALNDGTSRSQRRNGEMYYDHESIKSHRLVIGEKQEAEALNSYINDSVLYEDSHSYNESLLADPYDFFAQETLDMKNERHLDRKLSASTGHIGTFHPLDCNAALHDQDCSQSITNLISSINTDPLLIPCGSCYTYDIEGENIFNGGIDIQGKLVFPNNFRATIYTPFIIVQGELRITANHTIVSADNSNDSVKIVLTGTEDVLFAPTEEPNVNACDGGDGGKCNLGIKPFVVAGGKLHLDTLPSSCEVTTQVKKKVYNKPQKDASDFRLYETLPDSCPTTGHIFYEHNFSTGFQHWSGGGGVVVHYNETDGGGEALRVANRTEEFGQGPRIDLSFLRPDLCLNHNQLFLFVAHIKLDKEGMTGEPTSCKSSGTYCPRFVYKVKNNHERDVASPKRAISSAAGDYGEYFYYSGIINFEEGFIGPDITSLKIFFDGVEPGIDISIDYFSLALPSEASFASPDDLCGDLIPNGDAEGNGFHSYPFRAEGYEQFDIGQEEDGNRFFQLRNRKFHVSKITTVIEQACLDQGATYQLSAKLRMHSPWDESYYFSIIAIHPETGSYFTQRLLECPGQNIKDGWVECSGEVQIDHRLGVGGLIDFEFRINMNNRQNTEDVDIDDVSMVFKRGYVEKVLVDADDARCWGVGSDVHFASSVFYNDHFSNSHTSTISKVEVESDGAYLTLDNSPFIPIISMEESVEYATEMALVSRNVQIEGRDDEGDSQKGGYLQILHTPDVVQLIQGIEFINMGRYREVDRFPIQLLNCGSLEGTMISYNSIRNSHFRGIVIDGASDITLSKNVVHECYGHAYFLGGQHLQVLDNFASNVRRVLPPVSGTGDHDVRAFYCLYQFNTLIGNKAIGSELYGFMVINREYTTPTVLTRRRLLGNDYNNPTQRRGEVTGVSSTQAATYSYWEGDGWIRVRHIPERDFWYEGNDDLVGTDVRGDMNDNSASWSISFEEAAPGFNEFLFSSGNGGKWLIATKDAVIGQYYTNEKRNIIRSSISNSMYTASWYRRSGIPEDPWISLRDHATSKNHNRTEFMYGEASRTTLAPEGLKDGGIDIYIRKTGVSIAQNETYSYWEAQGWIRVRHIPQRSTWYEGNDNLKGTDIRGDPKENTESWSISFEEAVPQFDEFLFSSGNGVKWLIASKEAVIGEFYTNSKRDIIKSSISETSYSASWYRRSETANPQDPLISLRDHATSKANDHTEFMYAEAGSTTYAGWGLSEEGMDVYIRRTGKYDTVFQRNKASSNRGTGMHFEDFSQSTEMVFESITAIKNRAKGFYMIFGKNIAIDSGFIAENNIGVEMEWSDSIRVANTRFQGYSVISKELTKPPLFTRPCANLDFQNPIGLRLMTTKHGTYGNGAKLINVTFEEFDQIDECEGGFPIDFNTQDTKDGHFDYMTSFENVIFDTNSPMIDACSAFTAGIRDISITDVDGSSDPLNSSGGPSAIVSNNLQMKKFANYCASYPGCISYCTDTCLRNIDIYTDQSETDISIIITKKEDGVQNYFPTINYDGYINEAQYFDNTRRHSLSLPSGEYEVAYVNNEDELLWPRFVLDKWDSTLPACSDIISPTDLSIIEPETDCSNMIINGDLEQGTTHWLHNHGSIVALPGEGINGSDALGYFDRVSSGNGVGQHLDTRCLSSNLGRYFEIVGWFRLKQDGTNVECDPLGGTCPSVSILITNYRNVDTKFTTYVSEETAKASAMLPYDKNEFNLMHGIFRIVNDYHSSPRSFFVIQDFHKDIDIIIDNFSVQPLDISSLCQNNLVRNGDFSIGDNRFWYQHGEPDLEIVTILDGDFAIKVSDRDHKNWSIRQEMWVDCLLPNTRYTARAKFKLEDDDGNPFECDVFATAVDEKCPVMSLFSSKDSTTQSIRIAHTFHIVDSVADNWGHMAGVFTVNDEHVNADQIYIFFHEPGPSRNIIFDDISITPLPLYCEELIMNPSFEDGGASFWLPSPNQNYMNYEVTDSGGGSGSTYALQYQRLSTYQYTVLHQYPDPRCFVEGQTYVFTAQFMLLNANNLNETLDCNPNIESTSEASRCPFVRFVGVECDGSNEIIQLWNDISFFEWNKDSFNDFEAELVVTTNIASCSEIRVQIGKDLPMDQVLVVDNVSVASKTTFAPTSSPTTFPTILKTLEPTFSPVSETNAPTTVAIPCPSVGEENIEILSGKTMLYLSESGTLCTVTKVQTIDSDGVEKTITPIARSYDGHLWEATAGEVARSIFYNETISCYSEGCQIILPPIKSNEVYLVSTSEYSLSERDELARFLETTTFGVHSSDLHELKEINDSSDSSTKIVDWMKQQMNDTIVRMTSHRQVWREGANPRLLQPHRVGIQDHPCDQYSRWRRFAFTFDDNNVFATFRDKNIGISGSGPYILTYNGKVRTTASSLSILTAGYEDYEFNENHQYRLCGFPADRIGGRLSVYLEDGTCVKIQNPTVNFTGYEDLPVYTLNLSNLSEIDKYRTGGGEYIMTTSINDTICNSLPQVFELDDEYVFGVLDGKWYIFDPRLKLENNIPSDPLHDGGKNNELVSGGQTFCSNAPRTFLNEDHCILSSNACKGKRSSDIEIVLDESTLLQLYDLTGQTRFVYAMKGLPVSDSLDSVPHPCSVDIRSRWELILPPEECNPTLSISELTNDALMSLLSNSKDSNPFIRDIFFPSGVDCNVTDLDPSIELFDLEGNCWRHVHPDHLSVFDMTYWTEEDKHPGNMIASMSNRPNPIKKWAQNKEAFLIFPSAEAQSVQDMHVPLHELYRWNLYSPKFTFIGRYGDIINIRDLPNELRTVNVTQHFDKLSEGDENNVLVCGSVNEVSNDKMAGFKFDVADTTFRTGDYDSGINREYLWIMVALTAKDQLRQRVAWALSQILVIVKGEVSNSRFTSERFLHYYDIFVRNSFTNYGDILKEISYSPIMAMTLSSLNSRSYAYMWQQYGIKAYADENFSREVMQMFSVGLFQLNQDGSLKLDADGQTIATYNNEDIMSFSRAWTGFTLQRDRGNIETGSNLIDPMKIEAQWRDRFPKTDLSNGYIGDGYILCVDLPHEPFLKRGAKYRLLGSSSLPELMSDPSEFSTDLTLIKFVLDEQSSLREALCSEDGNGDCQFQNSVTLSSDLICTGNECEVDTLRVVQVTNSTYYEYVQQPCVELAFYNKPKKISQRNSWRPAMCANPSLPVASEACCEMNKKEAVRNVIYDGERVNFDSARERCTNISRTTCDFEGFPIGTSRHKTSGFFWTSEDCLLRMKVNDHGQIAIVHEPETYSTRVPHISDESQNFFGVQWDGGEFPNVWTQCDGICRYLSDDNSCLCDVSVSESRVFNRMPKSIQEAMEKLRLGAIVPNLNDTSYTIFVDIKTNITAYKKDNRWSSETVFEFSDDRKRNFVLKNLQSSVEIPDLSGVKSGYSFRNPAHFISLIPTEETIRDAQYETDAVLDHYVYHDNTAPFISNLLIQRLTTSNPSPRYVETVASAFKTGVYQSNDAVFGSGEYGSMEATIAAIFLDREARSVELDIDPSHGLLREPLIKLIGFMRSMDFTTRRPVIRLENLIDHIGEAPHNFMTVFSFFTSDFKPYGRVGDAGLVAPEGTLALDMSKIVSLINAVFSLVKYGLTICDGGYGTVRGMCRENVFDHHYGRLEFNTTTDTFSKNAVETFEGASLTGGLDNLWIGYGWNTPHHGRVVSDPLDSTNHVLQFDATAGSPNFMYSPIFDSSESTTPGVQHVVKFRYFSHSGTLGGGCIGYTDSGTSWFANWMYCDSSHASHAQNQMFSAGIWISCQFAIPINVNDFRILIKDHKEVNSGTSGDAFFDDILVVPGSGTMCGDDVVIDSFISPGREGYSTAVIDELATLLTAGRLSSENRQMIRETYDKAGSADEGLRIAQQLILTTSEFHSTNPVKTNGETRDPFSFPSPSDLPYHAVVYIMLNGGADSFNMLVPHTCDKKDMYSQYLDIRGEIAIPKGSLLPISSDDGQICETFGIHPDLPTLQELYNDEDLLFLANTGILTQPVTKENYSKLTVTPLFAHNNMRAELKRLDPLKLSKGTGVLGRISDVLTRSGRTVGSFSVDRHSDALVGIPGITKAPIIVNQAGVSEFEVSNEMRSLIRSLHNQTLAESGFFAETWSSSFLDSLGSSELLSKALGGVDIDVQFPSTYLGKQLKTVSRLIATREERGVDADMFYVEMFGFDTHADVEEQLKDRFIEINDAIAAFSQQLKDLNVWNNVTTVQVSDFARSLTPNSGLGTDHAWGGNYMVFGGDVRGGRIVGEYPDDFSEDSPIVLSRGRIIPTTPWDSCFQSIALWMGVNQSDLNEVCPNRINFPEESLLVANDLFINNDPPTMLPSAMPSAMPSIPPSITPSNAPSITPSDTPTISQPKAPTYIPSLEPTSKPSIFTYPSSMPSSMPSPVPTAPILDENIIASVDLSFTLLMEEPIPETISVVESIGKTVALISIGCENMPNIPAKLFAEMGNVSIFTHICVNRTSHNIFDRDRLLETSDDADVFLIFNQEHHAANGTNDITIEIGMNIPSHDNEIEDDIIEALSLVGQSLTNQSDGFVSTLNDTEGMEVTSVSDVLVGAVSITGVTPEIESVYFYDGSNTANKFGWNITLVDPLKMIKPYISQGVYTMSTNYSMDDRHYSVEVYKKDCLTKPTPEDAISIMTGDIQNEVEDEINNIELIFLYNQTSVETSDLWTANKTGGYSEFCIKVRNFLEEDGNPFAIEIHFLEVKYRVEVDSLTDFNQTIDVLRLDALEGTEVINYDEEIKVFQCKDDYSEFTSPPTLNQGDLLQLCVRTIDGSKFGVQSIKELDVSQDGNKFYPYIDSFITSPLAFTDCTGSNTTGAICRARMQLLAAYFDSEFPSNIFASGAVQLDYIERRLTVDVPVDIYMSNNNGKNKHSGATDHHIRNLEEGDETEMSSFGVEFELASNVKDENAGSSRIVSMGYLVSFMIVSTFFVL